mmetsp:Transcript_89404/g.204406  ORF Transcript_89404/g.204406 Transcript_89404/m.204406 type:complete len:454 (+) Transcript_89404:32-1393(+)
MALSALESRNEELLAALAATKTKLRLKRGQRQQEDVRCADLEQKIERVRSSATTPTDFESQATMAVASLPLGAGDSDARLDVEADQIRREIKGCSARLAAARDEHQEAQDHAKWLRQELVRASKSTVVDSSGDLAEARKQLAAARMALWEAEGEKALLNDELKSARAGVANAETALEETIAKNEELQGMAHILKREMAIPRQEARRIEAQVDSRQTEAVMAKLEAETQRLESEIEEVKQGNCGLRSMLDDTRREQVVRQSSYDVWLQERSFLTDTMMKLEHELQEAQLTCISQRHAQAEKEAAARARHSRDEVSRQEEHEALAQVQVVQRALREEIGVLKGELDEVATVRQEETEVQEEWRQAEAALQSLAQNEWASAQTETEELAAELGKVELSCEEIAGNVKTARLEVANLEHELKITVAAAEAVRDSCDAMERRKILALEQRVAPVVAMQ